MILRTLRFGAVLTFVFAVMANAWPGDYFTQGDFVVSEVRYRFLSLEQASAGVILVYPVRDGKPCNIGLIADSDGIVVSFYEQRMRFCQDLVLLCDAEKSSVRVLALSWRQSKGGQRLDEYLPRLLQLKADPKCAGPN